jgi:hypothetical protein
VSPQFAYLYFMNDDPDRVRVTVPRHVATGEGWGCPATWVAPSRTGPGG